MNAKVTSDTVAAYLEWWQTAGVTDAVSEDPADWFALEVRPPTAVVPLVTPAKPAPARIEAPRPSAGPISVTVVSRATAAVGQAVSLEELQQLLAGFDGCGLKATAKNLCFYRGAPTARLMIIGEAPGRDEDLEGKPFVGRAGQLLDRMLAAIGIDESKVHITNSVYWRPPGNRTPTTEETLACAPFLARQMQLVAPDVVLLLGGVAAKTMLGVSDGITKLRGKWRSLAIGDRQVRTLASLHPAYLLRTPAAKRQAWQDLLAIEKELAG